MANRFRPGSMSGKPEFSYPFPETATPLIGPDPRELV